MATKWSTIQKSDRIILGVGAVLFVLMASIVAASMASSDKTSDEPKKKSVNVASKVESELNKLGDETKSALVSELNGRQGSILSVKPGMSDGEVVVNVSTYFTESGDKDNGGQPIARRVFNAVCGTIPELSSLYVKSDSTGLESKSIYRKDSACK